MTVRLIPGVNDMMTTHPQLAAQLHPRKNGHLTPGAIIAGTNKKIWWVCDLGHEYQATGNSRVGRGTGCPYCANKAVLAGFNDLVTTHPEIAAQWHPTKNGDLNASSVIAGSHRKIWWLCSFGHEWDAPCKERLRGSGCAVCAGKRVSSGSNDIASTNPQLAAEWHPTKNGDLSPTAISRGSSKKVWWKCEFGHEWEAPPTWRTRGNNCPVCSNQQVLSGYNDLATTNGELVSQWHPTKNGDLTPSNVIARTGRKIWWVCDRGHEYEATGNSRVGRGTGCPYCANKAILPGDNDLATTNPELAAQWHPTKNGKLTSADVTNKSGKRIWWCCEYGHEWPAQVYNRAVGQGCSICAGQTLLSGFNDLATTNPELALEWHPTRNGSLTPMQVSGGSNKKFWWECTQGHEWQASPGKRGVGRGCPTCAKTGFDPGKPATLYFIANRELHARKVGITNVGTGRLAAFLKYGWNLIMTVENDDGAAVRYVENAVFAWLRGDHGMPRHLGPEDMPQTGGWTETFSEDGPSDYEIMQRIRDEFSRLEAKP